MIRRRGLAHRVGGIAMIAVACAAAVGCTERLRFTTVDQGSVSGYEKPDRLVIRTPEAWAAVWRQHTSTVTPPSPSAVLDFKHEMIIAVFAGRRSRGGYALTITDVRFGDGRLLVHVHETGPEPGGMTTMGLTAPFHIIRLPRRDGHDTFLTDAQPAG